MIVEINYTCPNCGSKELSTWDIGNDDIKDWTFGLNCSECGAGFDVNDENSTIDLV